MTSDKRKMRDVMRLMSGSFDVTLVSDEDPSDFYVKFDGPEDTPYAGGQWKLHVQLPKDYPFKSPSIGFVNRIFHPNVDEASGSVCLDVINQTWSPAFDLENIFTQFLPHLLRYPNAADPLNGDAAAMLSQGNDKYAAYIRAHVQRHALRPGGSTGHVASAPPSDSTMGSGSGGAATGVESESEMSELSDASDDEM